MNMSPYDLMWSETYFVLKSGQISRVEVKALQRKEGKEEVLLLKKFNFSLKDFTVPKNIFHLNENFTFQSILRRLKIKTSC